MKTHILTAAALAAVLPLAAIAQTAPAGTETAGPAAAPAAATAPATAVVTVADAYARSSNPQAGAAFMTIANAGTADCVLSAVTAKGFDGPELHTNRDEGGVMKMVKLDSLTVPAGGSIELKRGGDHIMLMKPTAPVVQGQTVDLALDFGACGVVPVTVTVDNKAGPAAGDGMDAGMDAGMNHGAHSGHGATN